MPSGVRVYQMSTKNTPESLGAQGVEKFPYFGCLPRVYQSEFLQREIRRFWGKPADFLYFSGEHQGICTCVNCRKNDQNTLKTGKNGVFLPIWFKNGEKAGFSEGVKKPRKTPENW